MSLDLHRAPGWLPTVLLAEDDTEESVMGSDLHQQAIGESHASLLDYAIAQGSEGQPAWYVSSQVTVIGNAVMMAMHTTRQAKNGSEHRAM